MTTFLAKPFSRLSFSKTHPQVKTQRALNDYRKSEYPHFKDELTKLKYIGSITAQRLREIHQHLDCPYSSIETGEAEGRGRLGCTGPREKENGRSVEEERHIRHRNAHGAMRCVVAQSGECVARGELGVCWACIFLVVGIRYAGAACPRADWNKAL